MQLTSKNLKDPTDITSLELKLVPPDRAAFKIIGLPFEPWTLTGVPASPLLSVATDWDPHSTYLFLHETDQSNPEMQRIYDEDQKPRQNMSQIDWAVVNKQDDERRKQVQSLLSRNALHSGRDFEQAAFIFQHGSTPDDYLLAHTLAMVAIARGSASAIWIASATLDRYLNSIKQPQIYGTQFRSDHNKTWTQEPYERSLIPDSLRRFLKRSIPVRTRETANPIQYSGQEINRLQSGLLRGSPPWRTRLIIRIR